MPPASEQSAPFSFAPAAPVFDQNQETQIAQQSPFATTAVQATQSLNPFTSASAQFKESGVP